MTIISYMRTIVICFLLFSFLCPLCGNAQSRAYQEAKEQVHKNPKDLQARYVLGLIAYRAGDYEGAIEQWSYVAKRRPTEPKLGHSLGIAYFKLGQIGKAERVWLSLLEERPEFEETRQAIVKIGKFLEEMGLSGKERRDFAKACECRAKGNYMVAIELLRSLARCDYETQSVAYQLAVCLVEDADEPESAKEALMAIKALPEGKKKTARMLRRRAGAHGMAQETDEAIECLVQLVKMGKADGEIHYWLGRLYDQKRDFKKTLKHFRIARRMDEKYHKLLIMDLPTFNAGRLLNALVNEVIKISEKSKNKKDDLAKLLEKATMHIGIDAHEFIRILEMSVRGERLKVTE
mgnify:FL=1